MGPIGFRPQVNPAVSPPLRPSRPNPSETDIKEPLEQVQLSGLQPPVAATAPPQAPQAQKPTAPNTKQIEGWNLAGSSSQAPAAEAAVSVSHQPHNLDPQQLKSLEAATALLVSAPECFGAALGSGGFGTVWTLKDLPQVAVKAAGTGQGSANRQIDSESQMLQGLAEDGYQVAYLGKAEWTQPSGEVAQGIVMKRVEGAISKQLLQTGAYADQPVPASLQGTVNQQTLKDIEAFIDTALNDPKGRVIEDIQFMVESSSGKAFLVDPARIGHLPDKGSKRKQMHKSYEKRLQSMLASFKKASQA